MYTVLIVFAQWGSAKSQWLMKKIVHLRSLSFLTSLLSHKQK